MALSGRWMLCYLVFLLIINHCCTTGLNDKSEEDDDDDKDSSCAGDHIRFPKPRRQGDVVFYHLGSTTSTQDSARIIVENGLEAATQQSATTEMIIVSAAEQTNGRGTSGRQWMGARGNTFVTICIRQQTWIDSTGLVPTLLPLKIGTIMAQRIQHLLQKEVLVEATLSSSSCIKEESPPPSPPEVTLKWPNDVLVNNQKIAGVLIESTTTNNGESWFLIGIGVNVAFAPYVPTSGPNHGRSATSISDYYDLLKCDKHGTPPDYIAMAQKLGEDMGEDLYHWLKATSSGDDFSRHSKKDLLRDWKRWINWEMELVLRDGDDKTPVLPLDVKEDGRLLVRDAKGNKRHVVTDYFL